MNTPPKGGVSVWGKVWSLGAKECWGGNGTYLQFVLKLPRQQDLLKKAPVRIWVHWYDWKYHDRGGFWPQPREVLKVSGELTGMMVQERIDKSPKMNLVLVANEVIKLEKPRKGLVP